MPTITHRQMIQAGDLAKLVLDSLRRVPGAVIPEDATLSLRGAFLKPENIGADSTPIQNFYLEIVSHKVPETVMTMPPIPDPRGWVK